MPLTGLPKWQSVPCPLADHIYPFTAMTCLDHIGNGLALFARQGPVSPDAYDSQDAFSLPSGNVRRVTSALPSICSGMPVPTTQSDQADAKDNRCDQP